MRSRWKTSSGQVLVIYALALPVALGFCALVIDLGASYVEKRSLQQAADAAALAAAQELQPALGTCDATCMATVGANVALRVGQYSAENGGPSTVPECASATDPAPCWTWPYNGSNGLVQVRLNKVSNVYFGGILGASPDSLKPAVKAVGKATPITENHCHFDDPAPPNPDDYLNTTPPCTIPGAAPQQGTFTAGGSPSCTFTPPLPTGVDPNAYVNTTPPCHYPGSAGASGTPICTTWSPSTPPAPPDPNSYFPSCVTPPIGGVDGAVALVKSTSCSAIGYTGAGAIPGQAMGAFVTNGGLAFAGFGNPKHVKTLGSNRAGCPNNPASPPSGTSACTSTAWGDPADSSNLCVRNLVDISTQSPFPRDWAVTPPTVPTPVASTWNAATDYPTRCHDLGAAATVTFSTAGNPPGIYCYTGTGTLQITTDANAGDGYTFFTTSTGKINVSSNTKTLKFYWPSACGARPATRPASFTCDFAGGNIKTISGYDPQTLLYSSNQTQDSSTCASNSICLNGNTNSLTGDIFAPLPNQAADASTSRAGIFIAGGALSAGSGFIETWWLQIQGNMGSYTGTGMPVGGTTYTGHASCQFPPGTTFPSGTGPDDYVGTSPPCTIAATPARDGTYNPASTPHCTFTPPLPSGTNPDDYVGTTPPCAYPGTPDIHGTVTTTVVGSDIGIDQ